jgi:signal transduction histidine kinase
LQEEKTLIQHELDQSRKLEAIGRLMSGVAHDMNNFLNPIMGYALLLRTECQADTKLTRHADNLVNATNRLKELASTLIDISRKKPKGITKIDLNSAVEQIGSLIKHSCPGSISIKFNYYKEKLCIPVDIGMMHSAILNIGVNAIDAMPDGGEIKITTAKLFLSLNHTTRKKFNTPEGYYAIISICDSGTGMEQEVLNHVFEPFFTTKGNGKGTGLGLTGVYNCMIAHNGCIEIESQKEIGTTVSLFFPM